MISTEYHTDDFYQRMLDVGAARQMSPINHGPCVGGPYDGFNNAHVGTVMHVAVDTTTRKAIPAMVASSFPWIEFHQYRWADGVWTWHESAPSAPQNPVDSENR